MKAWEYTHKVIKQAVPTLQTEEEKEWTGQKVSLGDVDIEETRIRWKTQVPGSRAPDYVMIGAVQATENMGYDVREAEEMLPLIQKAYDEEDHVEFLKLTAKLFHVLANASKVEGHPYWNYRYYTSFADHREEVEFPTYELLSYTKEEMFEKVHAGWQAQIAGAALGTIIEGYSSAQLKETFGEIRDYLRTPSTYNDDVLFELAFLEACLKKGKCVTSEDIGLEWVGRIEYTWTAEEVAFKNLKRGIFPPMSASLNNPWREWIGAQMRGSVCGMVAPGNPARAAQLAWTDGTVSHVNNGILGEVFNAILVSLAYVENDVRDILKKTIQMMPPKSEYYSVVKFAWDACSKSENWEDAWKICEEKYKRYNWIHTYPNAAAEVVSLYFGRNDFDECMYICAMCGQDVDCNAGQIGTIYGIMQGYAGIDERWTKPFNDRFDSLMRGYESTTISYLANQVLKAIEKMKE